MNAEKSQTAWPGSLLATALCAANLCASSQAADGTVPKPSQAGAAASAAPVRLKSLDDRHRSITYSGTGWTPFDSLEAGWHNRTAKSSTAAGDYFEYVHPNCTRLKWFSTKSNSRGKAEVFVDGVPKATVDTYSAIVQPSAAVFDSGALPAGPHTLKVVVLRQKDPAATDYWVECDKIEVETTQVRTRADRPAFASPTARRGDPQRQRRLSPLFWKLGERDRPGRLPRS